MTNSSPQPHAVAPEGATYADLSKALMPTKATLRRRESLIVQPVRFALFNARILRMITFGDH